MEFIVGNTCEISEFSYTTKPDGVEMSRPKNYDFKENADGSVTGLRLPDNENEGFRHNIKVTITNTFYDYETGWVGHGIPEKGQNELMKFLITNAKESADGFVLRFYAAHIVVPKCDRKSKQKK